MARRTKKTTFDVNQQPGLFDEHFGDPEGALAVHPSIKSYAARVSLSGGSSPVQLSASLADGDEVEPLAPVARLRPMMFMSFGSGSSGNCAYVGNGSTGFLIDAGVDYPHVEDTLMHNGIDMSTVQGIIVTHDHSDHVHYAYTMLRRHKHMRIYCTPKALNGMLRRHNISRRIKDYHVAIYKEFPFRIGDFDITAFDVSHDGTDNAGFVISYAGQTLTIATDLGSITDRVDHYMRLAQHIVIESNYDAEMLDSGHYPEYLKARIRGERGHLDNAATGRFLASIMSDGLRNVFLCHLSNDNNTPEKALATVRHELAMAGVTSIGDGTKSLAAERAKLQLMALPRYEATMLHTLGFPAK